jgi:hypothetical protein
LSFGWPINFATGEEQPPYEVTARPLGTDITVAAMAIEEESRQCPGRRER